MPDSSFELFARDDKWALGAGDGALFAPRYPLWLDNPGFWDEATLHQYTLGPLFTVAVLDEQGSELPLTAVSRRWTPAELTVEYRLPGGITASETRTVQPGGVFASEWRLRALKRGTLHLVAWTMQPVDGLALECVTWNGALALRRTLRDRWDVALDVDLELACATAPASWTAMVAERGAPHPHWRFTPFPVAWSADGLPDDARLSPPEEGAGRDPLALYGAVHRALEVDGETAAATFAMRVVPVDAGLRTRVVDGRQGDDEGARARAATPATPLVAATLGRASRQRWSDWLSRAPSVRSDDPYLEAWMRHRWAGLRLMATGNGAGEYQRPLVAEGPGDWHVPTVATSARLARDLRWLRDAPPARAAVRAWLDRVRDDGALPARLALQHVPAEESPPTAIGDAMLAVAHAVPDDAWVSHALAGLVRHVPWLEARAAAVLDRRAVPAGEAPGTGVTVVADALAALDALAAVDAGGSEGWTGRRDALAARAGARLWDAGRGLFHDGDRCAAAGLFLYAYLPSIDPDLVALERAISDPALFGTPYPLPVVAGAERDARVEPATACRAADAVARAVVARGVARLRPLAGQLVRRVVHTFFVDGDLRRPGMFEHYDALRGHGSAYRGWDDLQRAASADLVLSWLAGIRPHARGITIDPLPAGLSSIAVENLRVRDRELSVVVENGRVVATADGVRHEAPFGTAIEIADR